jgi:Ca2+-binding RTX toxin-like protein
MTTTYDVVRDFNTTGIQRASGDPFTYATETSLNVGFTLLPYYGNTSSSVGGGLTTTDGTINNYYFQEPLQFSGPCIGAVATGGTLTFTPAIPIIVPDDVLAMVAGGSEFNAPHLIVTRFTAPSAGVFDITGSFSDLEEASVNLTIVVDGATVFSSSFSGNSPYQSAIPFSLAGISLEAGQTVDFVVDSLGQAANDCVGLKALITEEAPTAVITNEVLSKNGHVTLTGTTGEAHDTISVYDGQTLLGTTTTASDGTWSFTTGKVSSAVHNYTATATDVFGNVGDSSNEAILGSAKNDILVGTSGNDIINGNGGNDRITGGLGADKLTGGSGKDTFVLNAISDSTPSSYDTITDFVHGQDKIDFTNIAGINASGGVPTFQGKLAGSGNLTLNAHSVAYIEVGGNTVVLVNTTNSAETVTSTNFASANMEIDLVGTHLGLTPTDFHHV